MIKKFLKKIFKIHSPSKEWTRIHYEYEEKDTKCDLCDHKDQCDLLECTHSEDERRHFIPMLYFVCPLEVNEEPVQAIWDPDRCPDGVFCPICDTWMDDYEGQPDKCPNCGVKLDGWIDVRDYKKGE